MLIKAPKSAFNDSAQFLELRVVLIKKPICQLRLKDKLFCAKSDLSLDDLAAFLQVKSRHFQFWFSVINHLFPDVIKEPLGPILIGLSPL